MTKEKTKNLIVLVIFDIVIFLIALLSLGVYLKANMNYYITYSEKSDIDYKVYLKENDYFKTRYLGKNTKYIASIIDYIDTNFTYDLIFPEKNDCKYLYKIMAELKVKDKDDDVTYYEYAEELFNSGVLETNNSIRINKKLKVDYNKYNSLMSSFVDDFDLDRSESTLKVTMKVMLLDNESGYLKEVDNNRTISLNIPLTTKTISISMSSDLNNSEENKILVKREGNNKPFLVIGAIWGSIATVMAIALTIYYLKNRTPHAIYKKKLKNILNNYSSYIQEIDNSHKIGASVVYKLKSFDDVLEVRDTIQKPILMIHNNKNTGTFFIIPANEYTIYCYAIRVVDIVAEKRGLETPDYDVNNLSHETLAEKRFTKQYIDAQIDEATRTITMQKIDVENVIMGNKSSDENIYDQLEKTTSFNVLELQKELKKKKKTTSKKKNNVKSDTASKKKTENKKAQSKTKMTSKSKTKVTEEPKKKRGRPKKTS